MRNLKKILALVLALVMSFSLMATANAFTDSEKITDTYETAVTVLDGLKVFQGYDDGSFQPQGAIKRSEVAAIIYRIVTGDVTDSQVGIYADYNKFTDVKSTSWYAGYVNFCANAEYIKGRDAKTFDPDSPVTGYEALAMILRAIGYDKNGEFTGSNWQVQTAATGELRGITKNITEGTLGTYASREVVAEILFQTILVDKVNYTPAFGYQLDDTSLGWDTFELEEIEGVVVANEYADLYDTDTLKAGKTELDVDGDSYMLDYTTTLEDIGEARYAYITEGKNVLALGDAGNTVFETGAEADIKKDSDFEKVIGLERDEDTTENFINFDGGDTYKTSDYRITYVLEIKAKTEADFKKELNDTKLKLPASDFSPSKTPDEDGNYTWTYKETFNDGDEIPSADIDAMKYIFNEADKTTTGAGQFVLGEIYIGTQSTTDISDDPDMSWKAFQNKYIDTTDNGVTVNDNENGNWLKVIDNDGDGVADIVLKTIYTVTGVEDIDKDGEITLSCAEEALDTADALNRLDEDDDIDVVAEDELAEGDIVYYAVIDGNAYTYKADVVTAEIEKVNRNTLTATTTDGDEYVESGVCEHTYWEEIASGVRNLEGDVNYDLYLDKFGYLAAFTESVNNAGFVLITDGYYQSGRSEDTYAAMVWNGEKLDDTDITSGGSTFIRDINDDNGWGKLQKIDGINAFETSRGWTADEIWTVVAALSEDGKLTPVDDLYRYREDVVMIGLDPDKDHIPDRDETIGYIYDSDDAAYDSIRRVYYEENHTYGDPVEADVRGLSTTVYYFVYNTDDGTVVREYVGYANVPELGNDKDKIENIYAVASRATTARDDDYYTAEIVVVEMKDGYNQIDREEIFLIDLPEVFGSLSKETARVIRETGVLEEVTIDLNKSADYFTYDPAWGKRVDPGLFYMWESADEKDVYVIAPMYPDDIADSENYVAGIVNKSTATSPNDFVTVDAYTNNWYDYDPPLAASYAGYEVSKRDTADSHYYTLSYKHDTWLDEDSDWWFDYTASVAEDDMDEVLRQTIRGDQTYNYVLIAYDKNDILYAISFRFDDSFLIPGAKDTSDTDDHLTYDFWVRNTPAKDETIVEDATAEITVKFMDGVSATLNSTTKAATANLTYAKAKGATGFTPSSADDTTWITLENTAVTEAALKAGGNFVFRALITSEDGSEQFEVTYTVTVEAAGTGHTLKDVTNADGAKDFEIDNDPWVINVANGVDVTSASFKDALAAERSVGSENATIDITGDKVTVTAEDESGSTEYTLQYGSFVKVDNGDYKFYLNNTYVALESDATYRVMKDNVKEPSDWTDAQFQVGAANAGKLVFSKAVTITIPQATGSEYAGYLTVKVNGVDVYTGGGAGTTSPLKVYCGDEITVSYNAGGALYHICYEISGAFTKVIPALSDGVDTATFSMPSSNIELHVDNTAH